MFAPLLAARPLGPRDRPEPTFPAPAMRSSVSQYDVTFVLDQAYPCGQYCTGDWWVYAPDGLHLDQALPASVQIGGRWMHGLMINPGRRQDLIDALPEAPLLPTNNDGSLKVCDAGSRFPPPATLASPQSTLTGSTGDTYDIFRGNKWCRGAQGFDSSPAPTASTSPEPGSSPYAHALNKDPGKTGAPLFVPPNSSVVKAVSNAYGGGEGRETLKQFVILTVVSEIPPVNSFRPPYTRTSKVIPSAWRSAAIDYRKLANKPALPGFPRRAVVERYVERTFNTVGTDQSRNINATDHTVLSTYGQRFAGATNAAAMWLHFRNPDSVKRKTAIGLIQRGIDVWGALAEGKYWPANGGHNIGRKVALVYAAALLGDATLAGWAQRDDLFQEDLQAYAVPDLEPTDPAALVLRATDLKYLRLSSGGTGYAVGDQLSVSAGTGKHLSVGAPPVVQVTGIDAAGKITSFSPVRHAKYLSHPKRNEVLSTTGGTGAGAAFSWQRVTETVLEHMIGSAVFALSGADSAYGDPKDGDRLVVGMGRNLFGDYYNSYYDIAAGPALVSLAAVSLLQGGLALWGATSAAPELARRTFQHAADFSSGNKLEDYETAFVAARAAFTDPAGAPAVVQRAVRSDRLFILYDRLLDEKSVPAASAFVVKVNGVVRAVSFVEIRGKGLLLALASVVLDTDTVTVEYAQPAAGRLRTLGGLDIASFGAAAVTVLSAPPIPANVVQPTLSITGTAYAGDRISVDPKTWTGSPTSFEFVWERRSGGGAASTIAGETAGEYVATIGDALGQVRAGLKGRNSTGPTPAYVYTEWLDVAASPARATQTWDFAEDPAAALARTIFSRTNEAACVGPSGLWTDKPSTANANALAAARLHHAADTTADDPIPLGLLVGPAVSGRTPKGREPWVSFAYTNTSVPQTPASAASETPWGVERPYGLVGGTNGGSALDHSVRPGSTTLSVGDRVLSYAIVEAVDASTAVQLNGHNAAHPYANFDLVNGVVSYVSNTNRHQFDADMIPLPGGAWLIWTLRAPETVGNTQNTTSMALFPQSYVGVTSGPTSERVYRPASDVAVTPLSLILYEFSRYVAPEFAGTGYTTSASANTSAGLFRGGENTYAPLGLDYDQGSHTAVVEYVTRSRPREDTSGGYKSSAVLWQLDDGTENNRVTLRQDGQALLAEFVVAGSATSVRLAGALDKPRDTRIKAGLSYGAGVARVAANGVAAIGAVAIPSGLTTRRFACDSAGAKQPTAVLAKVYEQKAVADAAGLAALTT